MKIREAWNFIVELTEWLLETPVAYTPFVLVLIACFVPAVKEYQRTSWQEDQVYLSRIPTMSAKEILKQTENLLDEMSKTDATKKSTPIERVFELVDRNVFLEQALHKNEAVYGRWKNPESFEFARAESMLLIGGTGSPLQSQRIRLQREAMARLDNRAFDIFSTSWHSAHATTAMRPSFPGKTWMLVVSGYGFSILVMTPFFAMRLYRKEQIIWIETPRIILAGIFWPIALFIYPRDKRRNEQLKEALQILCWAQSIAMSLFGCAGVGSLNLLKAQTPDSQTSGKIKKEKKKESRKRITSFAIGSEAYYGGGLEGGIMLSPWYSLGTKFGPVEISQFGFIEFGKTRAQTFTNHSAVANHEKLRLIGWRTELGGWPLGAFSMAGPQLNFQHIPGIRRIVGEAMQSANVSRLGRIRGSSAPSSEVLFNWETKKIGTPVGQIWSDGFYRIRPGATVNVGQPRLLFRPKSSSRFWKYATLNYEAWMIGKDPTHRFGFEFSK